MSGHCILANAPIQVSMSQSPQPCQAGDAKTALEVAERLERPDASHRWEWRMVGDMKPWVGPLNSKSARHVEIFLAFLWSLSSRRGQQFQEAAMKWCLTVAVRVLWPTAFQDVRVFAAAGLRAAWCGRPARCRCQAAWGLFRVGKRPSLIALMRSCNGQIENYSSSVMSEIILTKFKLWVSLRGV